MLQRVSEYIKENNLIEDGDRIVVGVSGGADSVCLLHVLKILYSNRPVELLAVHINHGIRGKAAEEDEEFVRLLSNKLGISYYSFHYEVPKFAREEKVGEEEAGRELRYRAFLEICQNHGCNKIAIAHNRNDNAETVLFHLFRGSGVRGLTGISPIRSIDTQAGKVAVIRPLLFVLRQEIEDYLKRNQLDYRTDASNLEEHYSRNKLRNRVISYASEEINVNAVEHISEAAEELSEVEHFLETQIEHKLQELVTKSEVNGIPGYEFDAEIFNREDIVLKKGILMRILEELSGSRKDFSRKHILQILELSGKQVGKEIRLPYEITARRGYQTVRICCLNRQEEKNIQEKLEPIIIQIPGRTKSTAITLETGIISYKEGITFPKNSCTKWFDYDKIENAVELRTRKEGDYLQINSLGGRKKLKNYFIDAKLPKEERDRRLLIADGSHIMWILGEGDRMSEKYKICEETNRILWINIIDAEEKEDGR